MKALKQANLNNVVFLDIETVRIQDTIEAGTPLMDSWEYKMRYSREAADKFEEDLVQSYKDKAALYAEFAKIVCITIGKVQNGVLKLKSYSNHDEKALLTEFTDVLNGLVAANPKIQLCGHAIKGFDIPFIMRRCLVNRVEVPDLIDVADVKPWLMTALDTLELWKGTGFYSASLINIAVALGLPSPKQDMQGSETSSVYYTEGEAGLKRITTYCEQDVLTLTNIVRILRGEDVVESVEVATEAAEKVPVLTKIFNTKKVSKKELMGIENTVSEMADDTEKSIAKEILSVTLPK
jgi:uncharacterized protein YprB with RNaseH-like and TPR domain